MSKDNVLFAIHRLSYRWRMTGHGFRALTTLNEMDYRSDVIERQLAHTRSAVRTLIAELLEDGHDTTAAIRFWRPSRRPRRCTSMTGDWLLRDLENWPSSPGIGPGGAESVSTERWKRLRRRGAH
jgi:hypothetical protein